MITFKLAISYMKKQRGKTVALLSSIALSVMLIFSMIVIRDSGYDSQIQEAKDLHGDYQVWFEGIGIDKAKQLENDNEVKKSSKVKYFCEIVNKDSGVKLDLNSFDKGFIKSLNYKMVGRKPAKDGEIVIEKEAVKQMGIDDPLNKNIDLMLMNKYVDEKGINKIDSANKTFKIVGLVEKPDRYYSSVSNSISGVKAQAFVYEEAKFPMKTKDTYKGTILLKSENNTSKFLSKMGKKLNLSVDYLRENAEVSSANLFKDISKNNIENIKKTILLIIVSSLVIYNIFNIILKDMIIQIGLMRAIGMSRKKIKSMFIQLSLIYMVLGTAIGILFGIILSYIGVKMVYGYSSMLTIGAPSIIYSFLVSVLSVSTSSFIVVRKAVKMSIIDSIKESEKYKKKSKHKSTKTNRTHKNIIRSIAIKNVWRNKPRTIITMLAITMVGTMFIFSFALKDTLKTNIELGITGGIWGMSYGSVDKTVSGSYNGAESLFYKVDKNMIENIKNIQGVKSVEPNFFNPEGYIILSNDKISKAYQDELNRKNRLYKAEHNNEYPLLIRGYSDEMLKSRESFIQEGENLVNTKEGKYKKVILVNNINSQVTHSFEAKVIDGATVGDIIDIKLPVYKDGTKRYETLKVEVSAIMKEAYAAAQDGNVGAEGAQVIFREDDYRELTNQKDYNKIYVMTQKGEVYPVEKNLEKLTKHYAFSSIGGKGEDMKFIGAQQSSEDRLTAIYQCLILLILAVNSIFIMRSNIIARKKELSTLRALGMSIKDIKKTLIIESEFYGIVASTIGAVIATVYQYIGISNANKILIEGSFERTMEFNIPWNQILILFGIFIIIGFVSVYVSKDKLYKVSITEGISEND
ncbi:ABC transporter permease [[Clostridium] sordellii]|uniref:FtsX-like permease family protein n=2 Tax=Paraclostridium sordellii TaxID=1505 RepID=A0ABM9RNQ3_PARSO|nr:FtsX-like permease family protein [Paeniclostridium sordellii]CEJ73662.1 ftsX-like permease family protein [[Clostridium] sordellii] [Paeniclostridium sordellii]CEN69210.1 ABC transporter permease [[Clostridium] sordellii] [Paeniclostridium sordellii]CEN72478.1 ABC transporter permease [[Clostridium] sordellii] [Paeniclostridium sordellii]CEO23962.1 ABC transporter permease [[Clostridium] sordellii] [Paeniclostridium sordellii]CEP75929.1 ABC transporter permease [[Clostridium] sordellii] [P